MAFWNRKEREPEDFDPATGMVIHKQSAPTGAKAVTFTPAAFEFISTSWGIPFPGSHGMLYRRQPAVRTVVDFLAHNVGSLVLKVYMRVNDTDRQELDTHPMAQLLRAPNMETTRYRLFRDLVADIAIEDVGYWGKIRQGRSVAGLVRIPRSKLNVDSVDNQIRYTNASNGKVIPRQDLVIFPGYNPDGNPWGVSPMETLRQTLEEEWAAVQNRQGFWKNASRQGLIIKRPSTAPDWDSPERERFREGWQAAMAGPQNAGKTAILEDDMDVINAAFSAQASEYVEGRRLTKEEVCQVYGIPPKLLGMGNGDDANANIEAFHRHLYQDTLGPWLKAIQDEIELQLLPEFDNASNNFRTYVEFNIGEKLKGSFEEEMSVLVTSAGVPIIAVNEARARRNLPRIDDEAFDVPVQPMNVLYAGQPSTQLPTADPGSPPAAGDTVGTRAIQTAKTKAIPRGPIRRRTSAADLYREDLVKYFRRQQRAVMSALQKSQKTGVKVDWESDHWDNNLTTVLFSRSQKLAGETGKNAARQLRGVYNEDQTLAFLHVSSQRTAQNVNQHTLDDLGGTEDPEEIAHVYDIAKSSRAAQLGNSLATGVIAFARNEAAKQSTFNDGRTRTKTWVVTSSNSRHPEMDGETVDFDETFSNGCLWPGDISAGPDDTAGCTCLLELN